MLITAIWLAGIGFIDDYIKIFKKNKKGLAGKYKVVGQVLLGIFVGFVMVFHQDITVRMPVEEANEKGYSIVEQYTISVPSINGPMVQTDMAYVKTSLTNIPFFKENSLDYEAVVRLFSDNSSALAWIIFVPVVIFIVTAVSNAANLTDGIDGLATGVSAIIGATLGVLAYVSGNAITADYLNILYLPKSEELVVFAACFLGACIGFLWHNSYPAKVFMGDTGSLMIGGVIAIFAILLRKELLIPILCGIFLMENVSVVMQVGYFKYTKKKYGEGRRIFKMSPLHHHYQKLGMHESKIVTRFWIVQILLAILTIITLKIR
jgi:phospho-N-acetylmuramoyl-pentapeptide-transferase